MNISEFPDQPHIDRVRESLWRRAPEPGKAAVMVGSGLSFNARPLDATASRPASWEGFTRVLVDHLYPDTGDPGFRSRARALRQAGATSGFLRLAQEYCVSFGRPALEQRIAETVRDERFEPGELHELLLQLPWADVLSTNWDTLLERTQPRLFERTYDIVKTLAEIHRARRPRLVKLHGSLPSHSPLIVTEEDFRRYPTAFAPFVNLVQQILMENVLCLIGFSGDDPNFLAWSGWVRDHLGQWAPPIYLADWLDLSAPQRRELESRNVIPIDLAHLPFSPGTSEDQRRRDALHFLLLDLKLGEPYPSADWPAPPARNVVVPDRLPFSLLSGIPVPGPRSEVDLPRLTGNPPTPEQVLAHFREVVAAWREQREAYPGWVVAPRSARNQVGSLLDLRHARICEGLRLAPPAEGLSMLRAVVWRYGIALTPLPPDIVERIDLVLEAVDPFREVIQDPGAAGLLPNLTWADLRAAWLEVALERLRVARELGDARQFTAWADRLAPHIEGHPSLAARARYERCLNALTRLDLRHVEEAIRHWHTDHLDPIWTLRRAGLFAELGMTDKAYDAGLSGLAEIRRRARRDRPDIASLSLESWALFFLEQFRLLRYRRRRLAAGLSETPAPTELAAESRGDAPSPSLPPTDRGESLEAQRPRFSPYRCDPADDFLGAWSDLSGQIPRPPEDRITRWQFDQGHITRTHKFRHGVQFPSDNLLPAYRARRLVEDAGLATQVDWTDLSASLLTRAAEWLLCTDPGTASVLLLRSTSQVDAEPFEAAFNRCRVALLTSQEVASLLDHAQRAAAQGEETIRGLAAEDHDRRRVSLRQTVIGVELASRLAIRLEPNRAHALLSWALQLTRSATFQQQRDLGQQLSPLFRRIIDALGPHLTTADALDLFSQPIPGLEGFDPLERTRWPDAADLLQFHPPIDPPSMTSPERQAAIDRLLRVASRPAPWVRACAFGRLQLLDRWQWLTAEERHSFAEALWRPALDQNGWPADSGFEPWEFAALPELESGNAAVNFRRLYLSPGGRQFEAPLSAEFLINLSNATSSLPWQPGGLQLSPTEAEHVARKILSWWQTGKAQALAGPQPHVPAYRVEDFQEYLVSALVNAVLPALPRPLPPQAPASFDEPFAGATESVLIDQLLEMVQGLRDLHYPVELTLPELVRLSPQHADELLGWLRRGLVSLNERPARAGVQAVARWWDGACAGRLSPPPEDLLRELALIVSERRPSNLIPALRATAWIVSDKTLPGIDPRTLPLRETFIELLVAGLDYLAEIAAYEQILPVTGPEASKKSYEIVEQRKLCVALARALAATGRGGSTSVHRWIQFGEVDPLPDVRRTEVT
jgi:SIR2-like domain